MSKRVRFRWHRELLAESLETVVEVTHSELVALLMERARDFGITKEEAQHPRFEYACYDERCGWDTYYVVVGLGCVGMSDGIPK